MRYNRWEDIPSHLQTRTQLARQGLRPARGQDPVATMHNRLRPEAPYALYDVGQAVPKRQTTPAQRAVLAAARQRAYALRHYGTCPMCGDTEVWRDDLARWGQCGVCQEAEELAQRTEDRAEASSWAQEVLANPGAIVLDTETTDLDGEVIELAITTMRGSVLFEGLVCPRGAISPGAHAVHGLTHLDLLEALPWPHLYEQVRAILTGASVIVAYNADFDQAVLDRTCTQYGLPLLSEATRDRWACAMQWYAQWWGEWSDYHGEYRWQPLGGGHRAHEDCLAVLERLRTMAGGAAVRDLQDNGREA